MIKILNSNEIVKKKKKLNKLTIGKAGCLAINPNCSLKLLKKRKPNKTTSGDSQGRITQLTPYSQMGPLPKSGNT
jgi:hypothetical protein